MTQATVINKALQDLKDETANISRRSAFLREYKTEINRLLAPLNAAYKSGFLQYEPSLSASKKYTGGYEATISVTAYNLPGFKDERLMALLEKLVHANEAKTTDYASCMNRDFHFTFKLPNENAIRVIVNAYVKEDSETCKKIVKGISSRVVEDIEYELVCE
jgi:hypothetical protein